MMTLVKYVSIIWAVLAMGGVSAAQTVSESQALDDGRQWVDARNLPTPTAAPLVRAAAANALNRTAVSERLLLDIIKSQPRSEAARQAHMLLSRIYVRSGRYRSLVENLDQWAAVFPDDPQLRDEKSAEQFRGLPDQINGPRRLSKLRHGPHKDFSAPLFINGKRATYLLDTGAWVSVMTMREAKRLGLTIREGTGVLSESSGKNVTIHTAVAHKVVIGSNVFHEVSFSILPDVEPWSSMPEGHGGIIGVPILLHLGCMRWIKGGRWELGCRGTGNRSKSNLVFFQNRLLLAPEVSNQKVFMALDTGAETTDLNARFAQQFAKEIERTGTKGTTQLSGMGGTSVVESITVHKLGFRIGDTRVTLPEAQVTKQDNPALGGRCCIGNIGLDVLLQTGQLTIDFSRMRLSLH